MTTDTLERRIESPELPEGVTLALAASWPDTAEAARQLGVSKQTVLRRYRCYRVGGKRRYDPADLAASVEALPARPLTKDGRRPRISASTKAALDNFFGPKRKAAQP